MRSKILGLSILLFSGKCEAWISVSPNSCRSTTLESSTRHTHLLHAIKEDLPAEVDVVVIGSGLAGLSCGRYVMC
jgi:hypothetical protein